MNKFVRAVRRAVAAVHHLFDSEAAFLAWVADIKRPAPSQDAALKLQGPINKLDGRWLQGLLFSGDREEARSLAAEGVLEAIRTERPDQGSRPANNSSSR